MRDNQCERYSEYDKHSIRDIKHRGHSGYKSQETFNIRNNTEMFYVTEF